MSPTHTSARWGIVVLLLLSVCINYVDRGSLSVAAPVLSDEFLLSPRKLGYLLSAFFWSYTAFQLVVGWLVDRYDVKWIYAGGFLVWSLAMAATGLANSFAALFAARLVLGIGESVFLPSVSRIVVRLFPAEHRGLPNALVDVGTKIGPGLSTLLGGLFIGRYGWRALFIGVGLASLLWLLPWIYSVEQMAVFGSLPFWGMAVASLTGGWASDRWIDRGGTPTRVRKTFAGTGLILCAALMLPAAFVMNPTLSLGFLIASCVSLGIFTSNVWAITQTLAGPEAAGKWTGIQNFIGNLGAVISP
ncbi:MAG: MFS transporter, partial [Verrucomicrobia bacterium]